MQGSRLERQETLGLSHKISNMFTYPPKTGIGKEKQMEPLQLSAIDEKPFLMRGLGSFCIADSNTVWRQVVDSVAVNILAAEGSRPLRQVKAAMLSLVRLPIWRWLLPRRSAPINVDSNIDVVFLGSNDKWIAFDFQEGKVIRRLATRELYQREVWIRSLPAVAVISPAVLAWDPANFTYCEEYLPGRPVRLHDLDEGVDVFRSLWPHLGVIHSIKVEESPWDASAFVEDRTTLDLISRAGLQEVVKRLQGRSVPRGLVHGDLKHPNVLICENRFYVIDWGEQFLLAPPLFDLLYYLYWHTRSFSPETVVKAAFARREWIEDGLPGSLDPVVIDASLCEFVMEMVRRIKNEQRPRYHLRKLACFAGSAARQLGAIGS